MTDKQKEEDFYDELEFRVFRKITKEVVKLAEEAKKDSRQLDYKFAATAACSGAYQA